MGSRKPSSSGYATVNLSATQLRSQVEVSATWRRRMLLASPFTQIPCPSPTRACNQVGGAGQVSTAQASGFDGFVSPSWSVQLPFQEFSIGCTQAQSLSDNSNNLAETIGLTSRTRSDNSPSFARRTVASPLELGRGRRAEVRRQVTSSTDRPSR